MKYKFNDNTVLDISDDVLRKMEENTIKNDFDYSFRFINTTPWFGINKSGIYFFKNKEYKFSPNDMKIIEAETQKTSKKLNTIDILIILNNKVKIDCYGI